MQIKNIMAEPEHVVEFKEFECPFCGQEANIRTKDILIKKNGEAGFHADGWTCETCGHDNVIYDECDFSKLKEMTTDRLQELSDFDIVELLQFAQHIVQKKEFEKAAKILQHILAQDPNYGECSGLLEKLMKIIELKNLTNVNMKICDIMDAMEDHAPGATNYLNAKTGEVLHLWEFDDSYDKEMEKIESDDYITIEPIESREMYNKMVEFLDYVDDVNLKEKLEIALNGPGAFRRFKDVLAAYSGTTEYRQMWFDFKNAFLWNAAMDFLTWSLKSETGSKQHELIEINGMKYPVHIEAKDIKDSYARLYPDKLIITVSSSLSEEEKRGVIENLKKRIQKPKRTRFIEPVREFKDGDIIDLGSKKYSIKIDFIDKNTSSGKLRGSTMHLRIMSNIPEDAKKHHIYNLVIKMLSSHRRGVLRRKLKDLNKLHFNAKFKDVRWKKQLSKWGSCSENKYINISHRLLFAPEDILEYVCVHELAHLIEFNHSKRFWKLVSKTIPNYQEKEQWLKDNGADIF